MSDEIDDEIDEWKVVKLTSKSLENETQNDQLIVQTFIQRTFYEWKAFTDDLRVKVKAPEIQRKKKSFFRFYLWSKH